jgi:hypothetical protein
VDRKAIFMLKEKEIKNVPWRRGLVVSSPPATEKTGAMDREIESCLGGSF